jgi:hypothetical protein
LAVLVVGVIVALREQLIQAVVLELKQMVQVFKLQAALAS